MGQLHESQNCVLNISSFAARACFVAQGFDLRVTRKVSNKQIKSPTAKCSLWWHMDIHTQYEHTHTHTHMKHVNTS